MILGVIANQISSQNFSGYSLITFQNGFTDEADSGTWTPNSGLTIGASTGYPGDMTLNLRYGVADRIEKTLPSVLGSNLTVEFWAYFKTFDMGGYGQGLFQLATTGGHRIGAGLTWGYAPAGKNKISPLNGSFIGFGDIEVLLNTPSHIAMTVNENGVYNFFSNGIKSTMTFTNPNQVFTSVRLGYQDFTYQSPQSMEIRGFKISDSVLYTGNFTPPPPP